MFTDLLIPQVHYNYIDSSEEQEFTDDPYSNQKKYLLDQEFYQYSHHPNLSKEKQNQNQTQPKKASHKKNTNKLCKVKSNNFLINDDYIRTIEKIIQQNHQKLTKKTALLIPDSDNEILQNLVKRKKNYHYFLKALQIDRNYNQIVSQKVRKIKKQNERKKKILDIKKNKSISKQEKQEIIKFVLDKKTKEEIVIDKIQKHAYKLGIQRIRSQQKKIRTKVKEIKQSNNLMADQLDTKQRNKIEELRGQLQNLRQINKVNKCDQRKALNDLQKDLLKSKKLLLTKAENSQQKKFII